MRRMIDFLKFFLFNNPLFIVNVYINLIEEDEEIF